ncbi:MAG: LUD domain-containing protein [Gammaproteobacteria bacterium]|jgi:L-lactate dehydrogenase complex protein LldG
MSGARDEILARVRRALGRDGDGETVDTRLDRRPRGPLPYWDEPLEQRFCGRLEAAAGTLGRVASPQAAVREVLEHLDRHRLGRELVVAPHPLLVALPWPPELRVDRRAVQEGDRTGVTAAFAGVAETGSLALLSGPQAPTPLNFLVDDFICLLPAQRIVPHLEDLWDLVRDEIGSLPRALNLITGPSRTADVEQTIQLGAHGPRRLHVLLLRSGTGDWPGSQ